MGDGVAVWRLSNGHVKVSTKHYICWYVDVDGHTASCENLLIRGVVGGSSVVESGGSFVLMALPVIV